MPLTKDFKETVRARLIRSPGFRKAVLQEAVDGLLAGDVDTGKALLRDYVNGTMGFERLGKLTAVPVTTDGATFSAGTPHALFDVDVPEANPAYPTHYAVTADGQRFLVNTVVDQPTRPALTVILNWTAGLKK